jgi:hypothetical protein
VFTHVMKRLRLLSVALGAAALLAVAGCDDGDSGPPSLDEPPEVPTLEMTATGP